MIENLAADIFGLSKNWRGMGKYTYVAYYIPPSSVSARDMDPRIDPINDYDGDCILTIDEEDRFGTDPRSRDSDGDGYCDGDENLDHDFDSPIKDIGETNALDASSAHAENLRHCKSERVALIALEKLTLNDRASCDDGNSPCPAIALNNINGYSAILGVSAQICNLQSEGNIWLRSFARIQGNVRTAGTIDRQDATPIITGNTSERDQSLTAELKHLIGLSLPKSSVNPSGITNQVPSRSTRILPPEHYASHFTMHQDTKFTWVKGK